MKEEMKTFRCESNLNQLVRRSENKSQFVGWKCHTVHQSLQVSKKLFKAEITILARRTKGYLEG
jgi:hypothetical protein